MVVSDLITNIITGGQLALSTLQFAIFGNLLAGGWVGLVRSIAFFLDSQLVVFIYKAFEYFSLIIKKELIVPSLVENITFRVYFFIAIILLFKLATRFMKYIVEPNLVSDEQVGTNAIIKRMIVGMCLIIFIPSIFSLIREFQTAIINDDIINKIVMDKTTEAEYMQLKQRAPVGRILGFSVLQGFIDYDYERYSSKSTKKEWEIALETFDPSGISINNGWGGYLNGYHYDYFPIISTIALGYTLWLVIKYCFDVLVRFFKLTLLQIISPIVMVDYIIDGGNQGTFKNWLTTVISTFAMLFIRILSFSFIIMVCIQMQLSHDDCIKAYATENGTVIEEERIACENSILYKDANGNVDSLLRAGIIISLLAFSMDLPKLIGSIFGLDLEQESSVTGMIQKVGGIGKMVGLGGIAFAGGMVGGAIGAGKKGIGTFTNWKNGGGLDYAKSRIGVYKKNHDLKKDNKMLAKQYKNGDIDEATYKQGTRMNNIRRRLTDKRNYSAEKSHATYEAATQLSGATKGMAFAGLMAAASRTEVGSAVVGSYSTAKNAATAEHRGVLSDVNEREAARENKAKEYKEKQVQQEQQTRRDAVQAAMASELSKISTQVDKTISNINTRGNVDLAARLVATDSSITNQTQLAQALVNYQYEQTGKNSVTPMCSALEIEAGGAGKEIGTTKDAQRIVETTLKSVGFSDATVTHVNQVIEDRYTGVSNGGTSEKLHATVQDAEGIVKMAYEFENMPQAEAIASMIPFSNSGLNDNNMTTNGFSSEIASSPNSNGSEKQDETF